MMPTVQLTRSGVISGEAQDLAATRAAFDRHHLVKLRGFIEPSLLGRLADQLERAAWQPRTHTRDNAWTAVHGEASPSGEVWAKDLQMQDPAVLSTWMFILNDPALFAVAAELTGCPAIQSFVPNIYKIAPDADHYDNWHTDADGERAVALSLNVGRRPYEGGLLQIRRKGTPDVLHEIWNGEFGDAMLMRIAPDLEHRLTPVVGTAPRVVVAGWFSVAATVPLVPLG